MKKEGNSNVMKIGIIRERKNPPESRTPLTPSQVAQLRSEKKMDIIVEASPDRCYPDELYSAVNVPVVGDLSDCEVLMGIKEVPSMHLIPEKIYLFFSHTIKKQEKNKSMLIQVMRQHITLIDYELLTNTHGDRIVAFGHYAGIVGAHNALWTWSKRTESFSLPRLKDLPDYDAAKEIYTTAEIPPLKVVLAGTGRVGTGAQGALRDMGIRPVDPDEYLRKAYPYAVFCQVMPHNYIVNKTGSSFDKGTFYNDPDAFSSSFIRFAKVSDIMINGIYWRKGAPAFFSRKQMCDEDFRIKVIADISCDMAPLSSIPSTIRPTTIADPVYGFDPCTGGEKPPFQEKWIDMMTIDNLPNELAKEASEAFGKQLIKKIMDDLVKGDPSGILDRATIVKRGTLQPAFEYLKDWLDD